MKDYWLFLIDLSAGPSEVTKDTHTPCCMHLPMASVCRKASRQSATSIKFRILVYAVQYVCLLNLCSVLDLGKKGSTVHGEAVGRGSTVHGEAVGRGSTVHGEAVRRGPLCMVRR